MIVDESMPLAARRRIVPEFLDLDLCCLGATARQIRGLVSTVDNMFEEAFLSFLTELFFRTVLSTAFIGCMFAAFQQWLMRFRRAPSMASPAARHVANTFYCMWSNSWDSHRPCRKNNTKNLRADCSIRHLALGRCGFIGKEK